MDAPQHTLGARGAIRLVVLTTLALSVGLLLFSQVLEATNRTEFCVSCHSMRQNWEDLKQTPHYRNRHGVAAGCPDCHVPRRLGPKLRAKLLAVKDVYHELVGTIDTPEKFEQRKWALANKVWRQMRATDSQACRHCHAFDRMELEAQDRTARRKHRQAMRDHKTCIDCHQGIAHELPDPPDEVLEGLAADGAAG